VLAEESLERVNGGEVINQDLNAAAVMYTAGGADAGQLWTGHPALCCVSISHLPSAHPQSHS